MFILLGDDDDDDDDDVVVVVCSSCQALLEAHDWIEICPFVLFD